MEIKRLAYDHIVGLIKLQQDNVAEWEHFTPHEFNISTLTHIIAKSKLDLYYVVTCNNDVIGYGMLRGMDEGYKVPSLGIGIDKRFYGTGVGALLMNFLETTARIRGYNKMRLRVFKTNKRAFTFYLKLGYVYQDYDNDSVLGFKDL